jgi:hypothetical protein
VAEVCLHLDGVLLAIELAAAPRDKRLLIGETKWGRKPLSLNILTDLVQRTQRMPQVAEGWKTQYVLFARERFTDALQAYAISIDAILVPFDQIESTLMFT